jgi:tetratricopeptide (TPR) repeat protein
VAGLDKALKQADSPLVSAVGHIANSVGTAGAGVVDTLAHLYDVGGLIARREARLAYFKAREPLVTSPQKMLDRWIPLLRDRDRADAGDLAKQAARDAAWVIKQDSLAGPETKAKAHFVLGLAQRNELNLADARASLDQALAGTARPEDAAWRAEAQKVRAELSDPLASRQRFEQLKAEGKADKALGELAAVLKAAPEKEKGQLLAVSSLAQLDRAKQSGKKLVPTTPGVEEARKDAQAAIAAGAEAEGNYALGRVAEELGDLDSAAKHYRVAAKYTGRKELASLYRLALARVLLKTKPAAAEAPREEKGNEKKKAYNRPRPSDRPARMSRAALVKHALSPRQDNTLSPAATLLLLNAALVQDDQDDEGTVEKNPNIDQAILLAQEAIDLGDPHGYLLLGTALARKGEWTKGLMTYITGLEKVYPGDATRGLRELVEEHPAFRTPDSVKPPQPLLAERHFSLGMNHYWARRYPQAEAEFLEAVRYFGNDARYEYFLGLARVMQRKPAKVKDGLENFRRGKLLEDRGHPDSADVNAALEKVQGQTRRLLTRYREQ